MSSESRVKQQPRPRRSVSPQADTRAYARSVLATRRDIQAGERHISLTGGGTGAVQRELTRLESAGLVTVRRVGKQKHYQANASAPVFEPLRELVLTTSGLADVLHAALAPHANEIRAGFIFGSVAKREDSARSDIDLLVVSDSLTYAEKSANSSATTSETAASTRATWTSTSGS